MTGLEICSAASPDALLPALCQRLRRPASAQDPFAPDWLVLPAPGLKHWLAREIGQTLGICAGLEWLQPESAARALLGSVADWPEPALIAWRLMPLLEDLPADPAFALVRDYIGAESSHRPALARRLAELYARYALWRPHWLESWNLALPGPESGLARWQAWLWRALALEWPYQRFGEHLQPEALPARIQVFACQDLPPLLLSLLQAAASQIEVVIYALTPNPALPEPLQALNGERARAAQARLQRLERQGARLSTLPTPVYPLPSLSLNAVSDPLRELEVLRDWLLARFEAMPDLRPHQILIASPNLAAYAPLLPLVFGRTPALPVQIQGRPPLERSALLQAFERVLALADSRLARAEVLALLECEPVARRFDLDADERGLCRHWLDAVAIRWGWDAGQRLELTRVAFGENSWQAGLERLLLGYALGHEAAGIDLYQGISPYLELEGSQGQTLAKLLALLEALRSLGTQLRRRRSPQDWAPLLENLLERFLQPDESSDWELIVAVIARLRSPDLKGLGLKVGIGALRGWLSAGFAELEREQPPDGRLLLAPLDWIAAVPARVICLLGLNERSFPRHETGSGDFDAMARSPQAGDPLPRLLDRAALLSTLGAATQALWISWQGLSPRDGSPIPPSAPVAELLEHWPDAPKVLTHPLQAHDPRCFLPEAPLSFRPDALAIARALATRDGSQSAYCREPLPPEPAESLTLADLLQFWRNPAAAFLRGRLGFGYANDGEPEDDCEALELPGLQRYQLAQDLFARRRALTDATDPSSVYEPAYVSMAARGLLPVARLGRIRFEELANRTEHFVQAIQVQGTATLQLWPFELQIAGLRLSGELELGEQGLILSRFGRIRPQESLEAWILHLLLQLIDLPAGQARLTRLMGEAGNGKLDRWRFDALDAVLAGHQLENLLRLSREGLLRPLPYFPKTSFAYAESLHKGKSEAQALINAENAWNGRPGQPGERGQSAWKACFRHEQVLDSDFTAIAASIWQPLLEARHAD